MTQTERASFESLYAETIRERERDLKVLVTKSLVVVPSCSL